MWPFWDPQIGHFKTRSPLVKRPKTRFFFSRASRARFPKLKTGLGYFPKSLESFKVGLALGGGGLISTRWYPGNLLGNFWTLGEPFGEPSQNVKILHHKWKVPSENFWEPLKISVSQLAIESCSFVIFIYKLLAERSNFVQNLIKKCNLSQLGPYLSSRFLHFVSTDFGVSRNFRFFSLALRTGSPKVPRSCRNKMQKSRAQICRFDFKSIESRRSLKFWTGRFEL